MSDRYSRRSPSPGPSSSSRRDRSPPPRTRDSRRDYDDGDRRRGTGDRDRDYGRRDDYYDERDRRGGAGPGAGARDDRDRRPARDDDRRRAGGAGGGGGDRRSRSPGAVRRRSRSPPARGGGPSGGDGGWGKRDALPDQGALVPGGGGSGRSGEVGDRAPPKVVEPDFKPSGALAAETKCVWLRKFARSEDARLTTQRIGCAARSTASCSSMPSRRRRANRCATGGCTSSRARSRSVRWRSLALSVRACARQPRLRF